MLLFLPCTALIFLSFPTHSCPFFVFAVKRRTNFVVVVIFYVEIPAEMPKQLPGLIAQSDNSWQLPIGSKVQNGMAKMPHCAGVWAENQLRSMALIKHRPNWPWSDSKREIGRARERECSLRERLASKCGAGACTLSRRQVPQAEFTERTTCDQMWMAKWIVIIRAEPRRERARERKWQLETVVSRLSAFTVGSR